MNTLVLSPESDLEFAKLHLAELISRKSHLLTIKSKLRENSSNGYSSKLMEQMQENRDGLDVLDIQIMDATNKVNLLQSGGRIVEFTDKTGIIHHVPDFTIQDTSVIDFDEETILTDVVPSYIPIIDEDIFIKRGFMLDAIRIDEDSYLTSISKYRAKISGYFIATLDQLVLIIDYYHTKARANAIKEAREKTLRSEQHYDNLPLESRQRHFNQKNYYNALPVAVKKKVTEERWNELSLEEKEKIYKPFKRYGPKKIQAKHIPKENEMWISLHDMYERFVNPLAVAPKKGYANEEVFNYWLTFRSYLGWKMVDIRAQREDFSESRKAGMETSFGDSGTSEVIYAETGFLVKRQNGNKINPSETQQILDALVKFENVYGSLKERAIEHRMKISHSGNLHMYAMKAIGVFIAQMNCIGVSAKYGNDQFTDTLFHEMAHWMDHMVGMKNGHRYATDNYESTAGQIAFTFRDKMNGDKSSEYIRSSKECFARAFQMHGAISMRGDNAEIEYSYTEELGHQKYIDADHFVSITNYKDHVKPLIEKFISENAELFTRQDQQVQPQIKIDTPVMDTHPQERFSPVTMIDRSKIKVNPTKFQGRQTEYSEDTVNAIVAKGYYDKSMEPIIVWPEPGKDEYIVLSGHSRWEASERLYAKGQSDLKEMPVKIFNGDLDDATDYAVLESNRGSTEEGLISDLSAYRRAVESGKNSAYLKSIFKPDSKLRKLQYLSQLNPKGQLIQQLSNPSSVSFPFLERNAQWVGELRYAYPQLSDSHENEIFNWMYQEGAALKLKKEKLYSTIEKRVNRIDFDPNLALNLSGGPSSNALTNPIQEEINEINKEIDLSYKRIEKATENLVRSRTENPSLTEGFQKKINDEQQFIIRKTAERNKLIQSMNRLEREVTVDLFSQPEAPLPSPKPVEKPSEKVNPAPAPEPKVESTDEGKKPDAKVKKKRNRQQQLSPEMKISVKKGIVLTHPEHGPVTITGQGRNKEKKHTVKFTDASGKEHSQGTWAFRKAIASGLNDQSTAKETMDVARTIEASKSPQAREQDESTTAKKVYVPTPENVKEWAGGKPGDLSGVDTKDQKIIEPTVHRKRDGGFFQFIKELFDF